MSQLPTIRSDNYSLYPKDGYRGNTRYRLLGYRLAS